MLASGSADNTIQLWDTVTGAHLHTLTGHTGSIRSINFSPEGGILVSGGNWEDCAIRLWDTTTGALLKTLTGHTDNVRNLTFRTNGHTLVSDSDDGTVLLWDMTSYLGIG